MAEGAGLSLSAFPMFDTQTDPTSIGPRWRKWMVRFENRITAMNLTDPERKLALLLDYAGDDVHDDFLTLTVPAAGGNDPPGNDIYHRSITALNNHYAPQVQREYEIFSFRTAKQEESESLDQFVTRLRKLGATCDFANLSAEIKSQVIQRCKSSRLRTKGLSDLTMTLDDLIKTGNAMDRAVVYAQSIEGNTEMSVNQLATRKFTKQNHQRANRHDDFRKQEYSHSRNQPADSKCGHCGRSYPHEGGRESCPAFKQRCHNCGTVGHYAKLCRKPQANSHGQNRGQGRGRSSSRGHGRPSRVHNQLHNLDVTEVDNHDDDYLYTVDTEKTMNSKPMFLVQLNGVPTKMLGDSGASVNVIDEPTLETLVPKPDIKPPDMNLYAYGSKEKALPLLGMFIGTIATEEYSHTTKVYVAQGSYGTLMSHQTAEKLNLITINQQAVLANMKTSSNAESIAEEFADRFEGRGRLSKVQVQIHLNPDVTPVIQPHRRIPFHLRQKVKDELQHLEDMDVIERVTQPTSWVSPLVAAPKPNNADAVRLCVEPYDVTLKYQKGADNPADYMSRHPDKSATSTRATKVAEDYVNFLADESKPLALVKEKIIMETQSDKTLQAVIKAVKTGRWTDTDVEPYFNVRNELSVTQDGIVLRGCRICIPQSQQDQAVQLAHQGHQGVTKTKSLIREKVWFPGIDKMVEDRVKRCLPCQSTTTKTTREPLQMTNITRPGEEVSVDFADVGNGQYLLIVVDDFSRYPEVEIISSLTAKVVIHKLEGLFARWGTPKIVKSDNGSPFQSAEFANYALLSGFKHRRVTSLWPEANGEAERFVKTIKKAIRAAKVERKDWHLEMYTFLRNYRATPHTSTKVPPTTAMIGREINIGLPLTSNRKTTAIERRVKANDVAAKQSMKTYADEHRHTRHANITVGDKVLIVEKKNGRKSFSPKIYTVTRKTGSQIRAQRGQHVVTRNSSFFKVVHCREEEEDETSEYEFDNVLERRHHPEHHVQNPVRDAQRPVRDRRPPPYLSDYERK